MIINKDKSGKVSFRLTKDDFIFSWFSGTGKGGSNRNKHQNCLRLSHPESGSTGIGQDERDRPQNQKIAFQRLTESPRFKFWSSQKLKELEDGMTLEEKVDKELNCLNNLVFEIKDDNGKWKEIDSKDLKDENIHL